MSQIYREIHIPVKEEEQRGLLMALLEAEGFESFAESDEELIAYIVNDSFDPAKVMTILGKLNVDSGFTDVIQEEKNWNEEWEKNYPPVLIAGKCLIRAPFHPENKEVTYEIVIEPKMSFGTAHHETTAMMIEWLLEMDVKGKDLLDMGCGTGVLAILANKMGALRVMAVDNDEWAYRNALDNVALNRAADCEVLPGDSTVINDRRFDIILANINRNILMEDMPAYISSLKEDGILVISGFYEQDVPVLASIAAAGGMKLSGSMTKAGWASVAFRKQL
jgi:ribosomal protein L11 methyltransferase